jgi:hypothetical protein
MNRVISNYAALSKLAQPLLAWKGDVVRDVRGDVIQDKGYLRGALSAMHGLG